MKHNELVTLVNMKPEYEAKKLYKNVKGIILKALPYNKSLVLFLNNKIIGDYAVVEVKNIDLKLENEKLPAQFIDELKNSNKLKEENLLKKESFKTILFKECDYVELIVEDEKYTKHGLHKGATGVVAIDYVVGDSILVDFSGIDKNGSFYGDCISVKISDLKKTSN